jgi:hypothetical protein
METRLRMKCFYYSHWNSAPVNKFFLEQPSPEPKVKVIFQCMRQ